MIHAGLPTDRPGCPFIVPGQHDRLDAHVPQLAYRLRGVGLDGVRDRDDPGELAVVRKQQRGFPLLGEGVGPRRNSLADQSLGAEELQAPAQKLLPVQTGAETVPGQRLKIVHFRERQALRLGGHGPGKRVLAAFLQRRRKAKQRVPVSAEADHVRDAGLTLGHGPRLVQRDDLRPARALQRRRGLVQDTVFGAHAAADHDGDRRRQSERAGAADDQH